MPNDAEGIVMLVLLASAFQTLAIWLAAWVIVAFRRSSDSQKR